MEAGLFPRLLPVFIERLSGVQTGIRRYLAKSIRASTRGGGARRRRSGARLPAGYTPDTAAHQLRPGYGCPPAAPRARLPTGCTPGTVAPLISPRTAHAPDGGGGGAPKARVGWGCRGSKVFGAWETGEGELVPPPRRPHPPWRYPPRSSTWGDPGEKPGTVARRLHPGHGCSPATPRARLPT